MGRRDAAASAVGSQPRTPRRLIRRRTRRPGLGKRVALSILALAIAGVTAFLVWCSILYPAGRAEFEAVTDDPGLTVAETPESLVLTPAAASDTGLLFIPGAKVPAEAYASKLSGLAASGVTVVISKPILNLAFFDYRSLSTFLDAAPEVDTWFVGGHSLGGVKACQFASDPDVAGLVLFGSYCASDLSNTDIRVLSIGASEDGLSTPGDIEGNAGDLPADAEFVEIEGMNHAQFGDYGEQPGDNSSRRPNAEVRAELTELLTSFVR